jgi:hypothetical protein
MQKYDINYSNMKEKLSMLNDKLKKKDIGVPFSISELMDGKKL